MFSLPISIFFIFNPTLTTIQAPRSQKPFSSHLSHTPPPPIPPSFSSSPPPKRSISSSLVLISLFSLVPSFPPPSLAATFTSISVNRSISPLIPPQRFSTTKKKSSNWRSKPHQVQELGFGPINVSVDGIEKLEKSKIQCEMEIVTRMFMFANKEYISFDSVNQPSSVLLLQMMEVAGLVNSMKRNTYRLIVLARKMIRVWTYAQAFVTFSLSRAMHIPMPVQRDAFCEPTRMLVSTSPVNFGLRRSIFRPPAHTNGRPSLIEKSHLTPPRQERKKEKTGTPVCRKSGFYRERRKSRMCVGFLYDKEERELGREKAPGACPYCGWKVEAIDVESKWSCCLLPICYKMKRKYLCTVCGKRLELCYS
ncbi:hypothetical protein RJ641_025681 [Dillenia turbinata]|uniref:Uncharacterized protein n=1 Tax=Dillenia turbinata TaxID=194707 RepID=A0AAN8ZKB0_9MAGN